MKAKMISKRSISLILTVMMLFGCISMPATAETYDSGTEAHNIAEQTIDALLYTDAAYSEPLANDSSVTITGALPEGTTAKAYPVTVDAENVRAAYDITLFDASGAEFEPESAVTVDISNTDIERAIEDGAELTAYHISDDETTEEIALKAQSGDTVTFEAESFSIYYIAGGTNTTDENVRYRRTYVFYTLKTDVTNTASPTVNDYEPYYFTIERGGRTMQTNKQTLTEGESLLVPQLPYHLDDAFEGWYTVTENGGGVTYENKAVFDTAITGIQASCAAKQQDETIKLYARFGVEKYLTFYFEPEDNDEDDMVFFVQPVVVPNNSTVTVQLFDYKNQDGEISDGADDLRYVKSPVPSTKNVFLGWTDNRADSAASATVDDTTSDIRNNRTYTIKLTNTNNDVNVYLNDSSTPYTGGLDFYPIFDRANWVSFDGGASGNGAEYQAPMYVVTTEHVSELPTVTRSGYTFDGWYYDTNYDRYNSRISSNAVKVTDSNGKIVNVTDSAALEKMTVTQVQGGSYTFCPKPPVSEDDELVLHAKWIPATTTYKIAFWAQSDTVHYDTSANSAWNSNSLSNYDFITAVDSSYFNLNAATEGHVPISDVRANFLNYLSTVSGGNMYSEYTDTSKFYYNDEKTKADVDVKTLHGDGSTVINVYYDRVWYKFSFFSTESGNYKSTNYSTYTYYSFPGGYVLEDGKYKYYAPVIYNKNEGPYANIDLSSRNTNPSYYEYSNNGISSTTKKYTKALYTASNLQQDLSFFEIYGVDIKEKWPTDEDGNVVYNIYNTSVVHSVVFVMPAESRIYDRTSSSGRVYDHYAKYYYQQIDQSYPSEPSLDEHFSWRKDSQDYLTFFGNDLAFRNGFTPIGIVGLTENNAVSSYLKSGANAPQGVNFPENPSNDGELRIFPYGVTSGGTTTYYWDVYHSRNRYNLHVVDADNIDYKYLSTSLYYEEEPKDELLDYDNFHKPFSTALKDFTAEEAFAFFSNMFSGNPVQISNRQLKGDNRYYTFGGVYTDSTCQRETMVYGFEGNELQKHISGAGFDEMPDHDITLYVKWELVDLRVDIDPSEGELSSTESTFFWVDEGEKIKEYTNIKRKYIPDENGEFYYLYTPYSAAAQSGVQNGANADNESFAKYIPDDSYEGNYDTEYREEISYATGRKVYSYVPTGETYTPETDPKVYPGTGSVKKYRKEGEGEVPKYHFIGWFKVNPDDNSLSLYNFNTDVHENTALKAVWRSGQKYRVVYDANEYAFDPVTHQRTNNIIYNGRVQDDEITYDKNTAHTNYLNYGEGATAVVKYAAKADESNARAQFLYWVDKKGRQHDYNDIFTISDDMIEQVTENGELIYIVRLTAHYSTIESICLQYNANTGDGSAVSDVEYFSKNSNVNLHNATRDGFTNNGKTLVGWSSQPGDNSVEFALGGTYGINEENADENGVVTLYAVWKTAATVTYELNGGSFPETPEGLTGSGQTYTATSYVGGTAPEPSPDPEKSGYTFQYWTTDNPSNVTTPSAYDFSTPLTGDITLYAYYTKESSSGSRTINVRYFYVENNGSLTEKIPSYNSDFWNTNRLPKTSLTVNSTATNISSSIRYSTNNNNRNILYSLRSNSNQYKVAIGIGSADTSKIEVRAVDMLNNGNAFYYNASVNGTYIKYGTGNNDIKWSAAQNGNYELFEDDPAVYVIIFPNDSAYTYKNITVTTTVTGDNPPSTPNFKYRVDTTALDGYPEGTQEFTLKPDETRTVSLLSTSTANQTATITQTVTPNNFTLTDITGGDSHDVQSKEAVAAANTNNSIVTFKNNYTKPSDDPITSSDENLTISGHKFTDLPESDRPAGVPLLNGDNLEGNELTVNIAVVDENGVIVDNLNVTGSANSAKFYTEDLEPYKNGNYSIKVMLTVENDNDPTVSLGSTYIKTGAANNDYSAITENGTAQYVDGTNTINWTKIDNNTYTVSVDDLFDTDGKLKGAADDGSAKIDLYSHIRTERIHVIYKYYDRDRTGSQSIAPDISAVETTITNRYSTIGSADAYTSNTDRIGEAITKAIPTVDNELDTIVFFADQQAYINALTTEKDRSLRGTAYYSAYYGDSTNGTYHTDCYGRTANVPEYMQEYKEKGYTVSNEKWVTYKSASSEIENVNSVDIYEISEVIVWGFNTPTPHTVRYVIPDAESFETDGSYTTYNYLTSTEAAKNADNQAPTTVYFAKPENSAPAFATYYFNQRLGEKDGSKDDDLRNANTHHLEMYGQSYKKSAAELPQTEGTVENGTIALPTVEGYTFDGWYMEYNNGKYAKICSDERFGDRVTTGVTLYAGYTKDNGSATDNPTGISLTKNCVEHYVNDKGVERTRYVTMLNAYGYDTNGENYDNGFDNQKMAMIYVFFDPSVERSALEGIDIAAILRSDADFTAKVSNAINSNNSGKNTNVVITIDGVTSSNTYLYTYQIVDNDSDASGVSPVTFTNKNRAQFTMDLKKTSAETGAYSKALVLAAVNHSGDSLKFSDNCLVYANGE